jgi:hypothetical protein
LAEDFLTFLPLFFLSFVPLTLQHYIGTGDLQSRLKLFGLAVGFAVLWLKVVQVGRWSEEKAMPWRRWNDRFFRLSLRKKLLLLFVASVLAFNAGSLLLISGGAKVSGDEPHYLLISQSLLQDGDFDLANNYRNREYIQYFGFDPGFRPHAVPGAKPGSLYSFHSPGISVLLFPFYALGSLFKGNALLFFVRLGMSLWGALFALQVFLLVRSEWSNERLALRIWFLTSFTSPVFFYSIHVYPEIVIAFLSLTVFRIWRFSSDLSWKKVTVSSLFLSSFIWFHALKYIALFIPLFLYGLWVVKKKARLRWLLLLYVIIPIVMIFCYLQFQRAHYGTYSLAAVSWAQPLTGTAQDSLEFAKTLLFGIPFRTRWETLAGYFLDQRDGLLFYAPLFFFALLGMAEMVKRRKTDFWLVLFLTGPYVLLSALLTQRAGYSPQARPLVAVIWTIIIWLGYFLANNRKTIFSYLFNTAAALSFIFVFLLLKYPLNLYQETTRGTTERGGGLFYLLSNLHFRLTDLLPSFIKIENRYWIPNVIWLAALILFLLAYIIIGKRPLRLKFSTHLLLTCSGMIIFFVWIVLYPRLVLLNPVQTAFPSGEKVVFYSISRSARMIEPGQFRLREDGRSYRFYFVTRTPIKNLTISFGSTLGAYDCQIKLFDETFFRGQTAKEIQKLSIPNPPRYRLGRASYYELVLGLGKGEGVRTDLDPYLFTISFRK